MITILGPTACGKTSLATALAARIGGEIISADSRQVYRRMDIGTGKDLDEYIVDGHKVPYHIIDICEPGTKYNLFEYQHDFLVTYNDIVSRGRRPILCGGTGLYIEAVIKGYHLSPVPQNEDLRRQLESFSMEQLTDMLSKLKMQNGSVMHNTTDVDSKQRAIRAIEIEQHNLAHPLPEREAPAIDTLVVGMDIPREERRKRITCRLKDRLEHGMVDEIRNLINSGVPAEDLMYYGLEYRYITEYVLGITTYDQMFSRLEIAIHQFAKRQMTWFRGMERRGCVIHWIDALQPMEQKVEQVLQLDMTIR
jgi:tRNA dimethylallyltransferase